MNTVNKGNQPPMHKRIKARPRKSRIGHEQASEKVKLLEYMFDSLCSVRLTAKSYDYGFLSYLIEMAALEVQKEIKQEKMDKQQTPEFIDEQNPVSEQQFKAG